MITLKTKRIVATVVLILSLLAIVVLFPPLLIILVAYLVTLLRFPIKKAIRRRQKIQDTIYNRAQELSASNNSGEIVSQLRSN